MVTNLSNFTSALSTLSRSYSAIRLHQPVAWVRNTFQFSSKIVLFIFMRSSSGNTFSLRRIGSFQNFVSRQQSIPHTEAKQNCKTLSPGGDFNSLYYVVWTIKGFSCQFRPTYAALRVIQARNDSEFTTSADSLPNA